MIRYGGLFVPALAALLCAWPASRGHAGWWVASAGFGLLAIVALWDLFQPWHNLRRNYPLISRMRWYIEAIRPELRQYLFESDTDGRPFSREQRELIYERAKGANDKHPFGTKHDVYAGGYEWIEHSIAPKEKTDDSFRIDIGGPECTKPYSASVYNISAMSFGSLSPNALRAMNLGAKTGGFFHDTGEGGVSPYHLEHGGDLVWEIGSGYFGCRDANGHFDAGQFSETAQLDAVKMIEIKLSQGAKPGHGGVLPGAKVTEEIARTRKVPAWQDCVSPAAHSAFSTPTGLLEFVARLRDLSGGKPTGFKLCIGDPVEFLGIVKAMRDTGIRPDFIVIDGGEGGTGAAPLELTNRVGLPLREGLLFAINALSGGDVRDGIRVGASGKAVSGFGLASNMALGADWCNSARGFMFAVGCVQSVNCHTDKCPTGVATQNPRRWRAIDVERKADRVARFHQETVGALATLVAVAGFEHPQSLTPKQLLRRDLDGSVRNAAQRYELLDRGALLLETPPDWQPLWEAASADRFRPDRVA